MPPDVWDATTERLLPARPTIPSIRVSEIAYWPASTPGMFVGVDHGTPEPTVTTLWNVTPATIREGDVVLAEHVCGRVCECARLVKR